MARLEKDSNSVWKQTPFSLKFKMTYIPTIWESCELTLKKKTWFVLHECGVCHGDALQAHLLELSSKGTESCLGNCVRQPLPRSPRSLTEQMARSLYDLPGLSGDQHNLHNTPSCSWFLWRCGILRSPSLPPPCDFLVLSLQNDPIPLSVRGHFPAPAPDLPHIWPSPALEFLWAVFPLSCWTLVILLALLEPWADLPSIGCPALSLGHHILLCGPHPRSRLSPSLCTCLIPSLGSSCSPFSHAWEVIFSVTYWSLVWLCSFCDT